MFRPTMALVAASLLAGCAAATPGFKPDGGKKTAFDQLKPFEAGDVGAGGAYVPSDSERALDCKRLKGSMTVIVAKLRDTGKGPAPTGLSTTAQSAVAAVRGSAIMMEPKAEAKRERARLDAYNKLLAEKQCPTMNVEAELSGAR